MSAANACNGHTPIMGVLPSMECKLMGVLARLVSSINEIFISVRFNASSYFITMVKILTSYLGAHNIFFHPCRGTIHI